MQPASSKESTESSGWGLGASLRAWLTSATETARQIVQTAHQSSLEKQTDRATPTVLFSDKPLPQLVVDESQVDKRHEQERLKQERLEQERLEQERLEKERLEKERLEQVRLEKERLEQERLEQERLEQERLEKERLEQERLEQERLEQERLEQERLEESERTEGVTTALEALLEQVEVAEKARLAQEALAQATFEREQAKQQDVIQSVLAELVDTVDKKEEARLAKEKRSGEQALPSLVNATQAFFAPVQQQHISVSGYFSFDSKATAVKFIITRVDDEDIDEGDTLLDRLQGHLPSVTAQKAAHQLDLMPLVTEALQPSITVLTKKDLTLSKEERTQIEEEVCRANPEADKRTQRILKKDARQKKQEALIARAKEFCHHSYSKLEAQHIYIPFKQGLAPQSFCLLSAAPALKDEDVELCPTKGVEVQQPKRLKPQDTALEMIVSPQLTQHLNSEARRLLQRDSFEPKESYRFIIATGDIDEVVSAALNPTTPTP